MIEINLRWDKRKKELKEYEGLRPEQYDNLFPFLRENDTEMENDNECT